MWGIRRGADDATDVDSEDAAVQLAANENKNQIEARGLEVKPTSQQALRKGPRFNAFTKVAYQLFQSIFRAHSCASNRHFMPTTHMLTVPIYLGLNALSYMIHS